jgi:hypothetical protein
VRRLPPAEFPKENTVTIPNSHSTGRCDSDTKEIVYSYSAPEHQFPGGEGFKRMALLIGGFDSLRRRTCIQAACLRRGAEVAEAFSPLAISMIDRNGAASNRQR